MEVKPSVVHRIRRRADGQFVSTTNWRVGFDKSVGRLFKRTSDLTQHLTQASPERRLRYIDCDVVTYQLSEINSQPVSQYMSDSRAPLTVATTFEKQLLQLINRHCRDGLAKPKLVEVMEYVTTSCKLS